MLTFRNTIRAAVWLLVVVALCGLTASTASAQQADWVKLGEKKVGFGADRDVVRVDSSDLYRKIRLRVQDSDIEVKDLKIHFRNGDVEDVQVREKIAEGGTTRIIDLPGALRHIEKITIVYRSTGRVRPRNWATLQVFGLKMDKPEPGPEPAQPVRPAPEGWTRLGQKKVGFGVDRDVIQMDATDGRFNRIRLRVSGNSIHVFDITVHFQNGDTYEVNVRQELPEGGMTRIIDLPGTLRVIDKITMVNRTDGRMREGRALIEVFGHTRDDLAEWKVLGRKRVGFGQDKDVITVTGARGDFRKLAILVEENDVEFTAMKVIFANGDREEITVRETFRAGTRSREIDLPGGDRIIQAVGFNYSTEGRPRDGFAQITLLGKEGTRPGQQPPPSSEGRWQKIGERNVDFRADKDTIRVNADAGPFRQVRFRVTGNNVQIGDITVHFRVGKFDAPVRAVIKDGDNSGTIDLPGDARHITHVELKYRTVGRARQGKANVEVWAK